jgi:hypothetical protein
MKLSFYMQIKLRFITRLLFQTNTFQLVLATDEVYTYAIFNYVILQWSSHTEAGGDTTTGEGGVPAFVSISVQQRFVILSPLLHKSAVRQIINNFTITSLLLFHQNSFYIFSLPFVIVLQ